jgi:His/Glu/Gln/Arg/opine family amino acid ABC transporter permease subunit
MDMSEFLHIYAVYWSEWWPELRDAAGNTLMLTLYGFTISLVCGLLLALAKLSRHAPLSRLATIYVEVMRGVPTLVILFILYFGIVPLGITLDAFVASAIGLGLHSGAYVAEIFRGGIQSIHRGQREAALACGMTPLQSLRHIILPQAVAVMLPPLITMLVTVLKDTSVCSLVATPEIMLRAKDLASTFFRPMHLYLLVGAMYFGLAWPLSLLARFWARRLGRGKRR